MKYKYIPCFIIFLVSSCLNTNRTKISGNISNPKEDIISFSSIGLKEEITFKTSIDSKGYFQLSFNLDTPSYFNVLHGNESSKMFINPNDNIKLRLNTNEFDESISYSGSEASNFLCEKYLLIENYNFYNENYFLQDSIKYIESINKFRKLLRKKLNSINNEDFILKEETSINEMLDYYLNKQKEISILPFEQKKFLLNEYNFESTINIFDSLYSLDLKNFNEFINNYFLTLNSYLEDIKDYEFINSKISEINKYLSSWKERKVQLEGIPKEGEDFIDFTYPDINNNLISLSDFKGELVYIDVWASWCGPCKKEIPSLKKLEYDFKDENLTFLSISVDENKEDWTSMVIKKKLGGIQLWANGWSEITDYYAIFSIPRFILVSKDGKIISNNAPRPSSNEIKELLMKNI